MSYLANGAIVILSNLKAPINDISFVVEALPNYTTT